MPAVPQSLRAAEILPMLAPDRIYAPFSSDDWLMEIKVDGWRCRAGFGDDRPPEMYTRGGASAASWFPEVATVLESLRSGPFVVDGELAVLDELGRSDFDKMQERGRRRRWVAGLPVTYVVFDVMVASGQNVMPLPLQQRKALLRQLLAPAERTAVLFLGDFPAEADFLHKAVVPLGLEGVMLKRKASPYQPGVRSDDWRKVKPRTPEYLQRFRRRFAGST